MLITLLPPTGVALSSVAFLYFFHQKQLHLSTLILSPSMAFTHANRALPRLATSTIRSQNIFRPPRASPFNHTGLYVPGSRRTFLDSWLAKVERKIHEMERKEEEILQEMERNKPGSRQRKMNTWLYKKRKEAEQKARALDKDLDARIEQMRRQNAALQFRSTLQRKLVAEREQVREKYPECSHLDNARWIWTQAERASDQGISQDRSKEKRKAYYELQLQAVNIRALWPSRGKDPKELFAWREKKRQEYEKILLQLDYGDGWSAEAMQKHKEEASASDDPNLTATDILVLAINISLIAMVSQVLWRLIMGEEEEAASQDDASETTVD